MTGGIKIAFKIDDIKELYIMIKFGLQGISPK